MPSTDAPRGFPHQAPERETTLLMGHQADEGASRIDAPQEPASGRRENHLHPGVREISRSISPHGLIHGRHARAFGSGDIDLKLPSSMSVGTYSCRTSP